MSIRPIDMQLMVHNTTDVGRTAAHEQARPEIAQQQFADKLHKEVELKDQQVLQTDKSEKREVDKDGRGGNAYQRGKDKKKRGRDKTEPQAKKSGSMFDVSI